jgi:hypothetical protein
VFERLATVEGLSPRTRADCRSALCSLARIIDRPLAEIPASPRYLRSRINELSPARFGLSRGRWANMRSLLVKALKVAGVPALNGRHVCRLSPEWQQLSDPLKGTSRASCTTAQSLASDPRRSLKKPLSGLPTRLSNKVFARGHIRRTARQSAPGTGPCRMCPIGPPSPSWSRIAATGTRILEKLPAIPQSRHRRHARGCHQPRPPVAHESAPDQSNKRPVTPYAPPPLRLGPGLTWA